MGISLLEPEPLPPPRRWLRRLVLALAVALVLGTVLYFTFRYYPEKRHVARFFDALVAEDYRQAYELWKPQPSFTYEQFLSIWGPNGDYGRIRSYELVEVESSRAVLLRLAVEGGSRQRTLTLEGNASGIVVSVRLNNLDPPVRLWVEKKDKSLSFPPF
ncbi:MAG: hypothetical protein ACE5H2_01225 [Terriglobia bacterium]